MKGTASKISGYSLTSLERTSDSIWGAVRNKLREECPAATYLQDIARLRLRGSETGAIIIVAPSGLHRDRVEKHWGARIRALWAELDATHRTVHMLADDEAEPQLPEISPTECSAEAVAEPGKSELGSDVSAFGGTRFTFDSFCLGPANEIAAAAARTMVGAQSPPFNPVFFYGDYGFGKTHLMHAIASAFEHASRPRKALYLTAEEFLSGFVAAMKARDMASFKKMVRRVDVLLIDDVHFIAGKPKTEGELLDTVAVFVKENKQVVLASHRPPTELQLSDERLRSLLTGGLSCPLGKPDLDLRRQILDRKIAQAKCHYPVLDVPDSVRDFLTARITTSPRELEGALNNIICCTALLGLPVTMEAVSTALRDLSRYSARRLEVNEIQRLVAKHFEVPVSAFKTQENEEAIVRYRDIAIYLSKIMTTASLAVIGQNFGGLTPPCIGEIIEKIEILKLNKSDEYEEIQEICTFIDWYSKIESAIEKEVDHDHQHYIDDEEASQFNNTISDLVKSYDKKRVLIDNEIDRIKSGHRPFEKSKVKN